MKNVMYVKPHMGFWVVACADGKILSPWFPGRNWCVEYAQKNWPGRIDL